MWTYPQAAVAAGPDNDRRAGSGRAAADDGRMARANRQIRMALDQHVDRIDARTRRRRRLRAIDRGLDRIEQLHSRDIMSGAEFCRSLVERIAGECGATPPPPVRLAATSYHLHSALLLWQEAVLDEAVPQRRLHPDLGREVEEVGIHGRARRTGATTRAPRIA